MLNPLPGMQRVYTATRHDPCIPFSLAQNSYISIFQEFIRVQNTKLKIPHNKTTF